MRAPYAGLTSPAVRPRAAISPGESALTTLVSGCWGSAKCFVVAAIAASAVATATLKYLNDGGPRSAERRLEGDCIDEGCPGVVTWTTQPAGGALSIMHATWRVSRTRVKAVQFPALYSASMAGAESRLRSTGCVRSRRHVPTDMSANGRMPTLTTGEEG